MAFSPLSLNRSRLPHRFQLALETRYSFLNAPAVNFQLRFTRTPCANATCLPREVMPHPSQARQKILQLRQLDLQAALAAARPLRKNIKDQLRPIEYLARQ